MIKHHINARLEMINERGKIVYGRSMSGYDVDIDALIKVFFDKMPDYVNQKQTSLKVSSVERY